MIFPNIQFRQSTFGFPRTILLTYVSSKIGLLVSTLFTPMPRFLLPPENVRKSLVFWRFLGVWKQDIGVKRVNTSLIVFVLFLRHNFDQMQLSIIQKILVIKCN